MAKIDEQNKSQEVNPLQLNFFSQKRKIDSTEHSMSKIALRRFFNQVYHQFSGFDTLILTNDLSKWLYRQKTKMLRLKQAEEKLDIVGFVDTTTNEVISFEGYSKEEIDSVILGWYNKLKNLKTF
jgi:hypothetical protein